MANTYNFSPMAITSNSSGAALGVPVLVSQIYWYNPTASADVFSITDNATGNVILQGYAQAANQSQVWTFDRESRLSLPGGNNDWSVSITGGTLYIYKA